MHKVHGAGVRAFKIAFGLGLVCFVSIPAAAQTIHDSPLSERRVAYEMEVTLDPSTRSIEGRQRVTWRNPDSVPVGELQFHLYLNAFRDSTSTFMKESGGRHRGFSADGEERWGGIDINRMQIVRNTPGDAGPLGAAPESIDLTDAITFIHPDDDNTQDRTVVSVQLPEPVAPGAEITLDIDFTSRMPQIFARTGWERKDNDSLFFMVAQWFPKLGVYEVPGQRYVPADAPAGQWNTHQFHANSEFYADFGTYEVSLTAPEHYRIGATGKQVGEVILNGQKQVTYRADDVHDFAWTASGDLLEFTDQWRHVAIKLLIQPEHRAQVQRHFDAAKVALDYYDQWLGEYPYDTLTLVDGIGGSNGMEYPTLITCGTFYMLPEWARPLELVTIHEFGHQYFYGLLASNEFEESWMDEGMNSYIEMRIMDTHYGRGSVMDIPGIELSDGEVQRMSYLKNNPSSGPMFAKTWEMSSSDYGKASYAKPAVVLATLERYLGWDAMQRILHTYYERWRFKHPTTRDFIAIVEEVAGQPMTWFFDPYVYGTAVVDYAVDAIVNTPPTEDGGRYQSVATLLRKDNGVFPQVVRVRFADGSVEDVAWDGQGAKHELSFNRDTPIAEVFIDPDHIVWLDVDRLNNRRLVEPETTYARRQQFNATVWLQQLFYLFGGLF
ncbi:MAG: M1 family metallopeptidase [Rhodothermales bacterium]|nr:M1 family metallopeptidase [Rhodothermales bacterium]